MSRHSKEIISDISDSQNVSGTKLYQSPTLHRAVSKALSFLIISSPSTFGCAKDFNLN